MKCKQIKVLYITLEYGKCIAGGLGRVTNELTEEIAEICEFDVFFLYKQQKSENFLSDVFEVRNRKITNNSSYVDYKECLIGLLKRNDYTNVHIMNAVPQMIDCIEIVNEYSSASRIIYSCHSILKYENGIRRNFKSSLASEKYILENADIIHVLNKTSLSYLESSYANIARRKKIAIIPNGIHENAFKEVDHEFLAEVKKHIQADTNKIVLCMSRWSHGKGIEKLLEAVPKVVKKYPNIKFIIAGRKQQSWEKDSAEYVQKIDEKIAALQEHIYVLGWIGTAQRNALYEIADAFVMPSYLEYFPYSILEPMIGKLPIVSSKISCVEELLTHGEECLMYDPYNSEDLSENILKLLIDESLQQHLVQKSYCKVSENYAWNIIAKVYMKMYEESNCMNVREKFESSAEEYI